MATPEYSKAYYEKNKERLLARQKIRSKENYLANKPAYRARAAAWKEANPERARELQKMYSAKNAEKIKTRSKEWYANNKARAATNARSVKLKMYGLTPEEYQTLLESQNHRCAICGAQDALDGKSNRMYVDHCHTTKAVRGLLCQKCNAGLGMFKDDVVMLNKAIAYLNRSSSGAT